MDFNVNIFIDYISNKNFLKSSYTRFRNKIGLNIDGKFLRERGEVSLVWPFKDCVLEGGQTKEEETRKEIFFNEILAQDEIDRLFDTKVLTNWKRYTSEGEKKVTKIDRDEEGTIKENLIIKGNNLVALHSLKNQFRGKVKLIYIDPPYNTGSDSFKYNDGFNHSNWLTFMKNRLEIAREFLREDGVIFVQCDDNEQAYLKILMDEIFSKDNFLGNITLKSKGAGGVGQEGFLFDICEYILIYGNKNLVKNKVPFIKTELEDKTKKSYNNILRNFGKEKYIKDITGGNVGKISVFKHENTEIDRFSKNSRTRENYYINFDRIFRTTNPQGGLMKRVMPQIPDRGFYSIEYVPTKGRFSGKKHRCFFLNGSLVVWLRDSSLKNDKDRTVYKLNKSDNLWIENLYQGIAGEGGVKLKAGKKPEKLIHRIIEMTTEKGDIVLDYHLGSGTTCAVAHKTGRQYIGIEQLDYGKNDSVTRLQNVIGGDTSGISKLVNWKGGNEFIYCELKKYNESYINKIQRAKSSDEIIFLWKNISKNSFLNWYVNSEVPEEAISDFIDIGKSKNGLKKQKNLLIELLNKNQLYVNLSEIEEKSFNVSKEEKKLNKLFFSEE